MNPRCNQLIEQHELHTRRPLAPSSTYGETDVRKRGSVHLSLDPIILVLKRTFDFSKTFMDFTDDTTFWVMRLRASVRFHYN